MVAVVGTNTLNSGGVSYKAKQLYTHELYNYQEFYNDIGLVQLACPIQFTNLVKPIPMASFDTPAGTRATMTGWGYLSVRTKTVYKMKIIQLILTSSVIDCHQKVVAISNLMI